MSFQVRAPALLVFLGVLLAFSVPSRAAESEPEQAAAVGPSPSFSLSLQQRTRLEIRPDYVFDGQPGTNPGVGSRSRIGVRAGYGVLSAFFQLQDVRYWGSETSTRDESADKLDIHQFYGELSSSYGLSLRVGRQELKWHGARLIGPSNWAHGARSFDAIRVMYGGERAEGELLYALMLDRPPDVESGEGPLEDVHLLGIRGGPHLAEALALEGVFILRVDAGVEEVLATFGGHAKGSVGSFSYMLEGYGQLGDRSVWTIEAFMAAFRAGVTVPKAARLYLGGGLDLISGDKDPLDGTVRSFDMLYGAKHIYYGHMDVYKNLFLDTLGQGLVDGLFEARVSPSRCIDVQVAAHAFFASNLIENWVPPEEELREPGQAFYGVEVDGLIRWKPVSVYTLTGGAYVFVPGGLYGQDAKADFGGYLMSDIHFK